MTPERLSRIKKVLNNRQPDLAVVMENIEDPHNIFAVMRTCDAVGIQDIYVINTDMNQYKRFGSASSSSAAKWLTIHQFEYLDECMDVVRSKYDKVFASYLSEDSETFYDIDYTGSIALVFGNEKKGVSDSMLAQCDGRFIIPQAGMIKSLNISVACAITLYEAKRQRMEKGFYNGASRLSRDTQNVLFEKWSQSKYKK